MQHQISSNCMIDDSYVNGQVLGIHLYLRKRGLDILIASSISILNQSKLSIFNY